MPSFDFAPETLRRLPLAEAVLRLWQWHCDPHNLNELFQTHRGLCYTHELSFATLVALIGDALLEHDGSARQSFQRGQDNGELTVTVQAAYQKLGRLPLAVSENFLSASTRRLLELLPTTTQAEADIPDSLRGFTVVAVDGKAIKRVPKRLRPLRQCRGGVLGGKALVALHLASGLAVAMASDRDGDTNESKLVPALLPQVRPLFAGIVWLADRQFGNPMQAAALTRRDGDHFVLRHDGKTAFTPDASQPVRYGKDSQGRAVAEDWGWWGGPRNARRRYLRRLVLNRPDAEPIILISDLVDAATYPAAELLTLYWARWGIERVFQQITEVFPLRRLIGTSPQGNLFQLAFCLLLYNQIQVVRAYVAEGAGRPRASVSPELLFEDVQRQLIALHEVLDAEEIVSLLPALATGEQLRQRLGALLHRLWSDRWQKAAVKKRTPPHSGGNKREHKSAYRLIQQHRLAQRKRAQT